MQITDHYATNVKLSYSSAMSNICNLNNPSFLKKEIHYVKFCRLLGEETWDEVFLSNNPSFAFDVFLKTFNLILMMLRLNRGIK